MRAFLAACLLWISSMAVAEGPFQNVIAVSWPSAAGDVVIGGTFVDIGGDTDLIHVARWDGSAWREMDNTSLNSAGSNVTAFEQYDDELWIAGDFNEIASGGDTLRGVAYWHAATQRWKARGTGVSGGASPRARTLFAATDGYLYIGGNFTAVDKVGPGSISALNVARWSGTEYEDVGDLSQLASSGGNVNIFVEHGGLLYAGGTFEYINGANISGATDGLAVWNGAAWSQTGNGGLGSTLNGIADLQSWGGKLVRYCPGGTEGAVTYDTGTGWSRVGLGTFSGGGYTNLSDGGPGALEVDGSGRLRNVSATLSALSAAWQSDASLPVGWAFAAPGAQYIAADGTLYATITDAGNTYVARYDGSWVKLGGAINGMVRAIRTFATQ